MGKIGPFWTILYILGRLKLKLALKLELWVPSFTLRLELKLLQSYRSSSSLIFFRVSSRLELELELLKSF